MRFMKDSTYVLRQPESLFVGLDQSYSGFGFVVLDETGHCHQKTLMKYPATKFKSDSERLARIYDDLCMYLNIHKSSGANIVVGMEGYSYGSKLNREKLGELGGIVKLAIYHTLGAVPESIPPKSLKSFMTGSGNASKEDMVNAVQKLDPEITNHNLADAYSVAFMIYSS